MAAEVPMDSITTDVQPFTSPPSDPVLREPVNDRPPPTVDLDDWTWPPGWEKRLGDPYQLGTGAPPAISISIGQRRYWDEDGKEVIVSLNSSQEVLTPLSVFQYALVFSDWLDTRSFVLGMRLNGLELFITVGGRQMFTACDSWLLRWIHFGS